MYPRAVFLLLFLLFPFSSHAWAESTHPHYMFILPDGYVGWVQIIFNDRHAGPIPRKDNSYGIVVPRSGIIRTSDTRIDDPTETDEFYYYRTLLYGASELRSVSPEYVIQSVNHGGFSVKDTGGKGSGYSWFIFIGPPGLRTRVPFADWDKVVADIQKTHPGKTHIKFSGRYPTPGMWLRQDF